MPSTSSRGFNPRPYTLNSVEKTRQSFQRVVLALQRDDHRVCRGERVDGEQAEGGRAVDGDVVVGAGDRLEHLPEPSLPILHADELDLRPDQVRTRGRQVEVRELGGSGDVENDAVSHQRVIEMDFGVDGPVGAAGNGLGIDVHEQGGSLRRRQRGASG